MQALFHPSTSMSIIAPPFFSGIVPLPPSVNASYGRGANAHKPIIATEALRQFKQDAALMLSQAECKYSLLNAIREAKEFVPLALSMKVYIKKLGKRDLDNCIKAVQDAVFARLELNDKLVVDLHVKEFEDASNPRVEVEVACLLTAGE